MMRSVMAIVLAVMAVFAFATTNARAQEAERMLADARAALPANCAELPEIDRLGAILCSGEMRIGVRTGYPRFAEGRDGERTGFEIDLAQDLAARLGVELVLEQVTPVTRLSALADGSIDLVIATMGHNTVRDANARFILPHYYSSETILIGSRRLDIETWEDAADRTVCTTVGNFANSLLVERVARVLLFDTPSRLVENLESGICSLIVQDDSVMVDALASENFGGRFERKLGLSEIPWGMAVGLDGTERLAAVLDATIREMHADGALLALAEPHGIETGFLERAQETWSQPFCREAPSTCVLPPLETALASGPLEGVIEVVQVWLEQTFGVLYSQFAWDLFVNGIVTSLIAVVGVLVATLLAALVFASGLLVRNRLVRSALHLLLVVFQGSPPILILVFVATIANAALVYSPTVALFVAVVAIGLVNGAFAGQGIADGWKSLDDHLAGGTRMRHAIVRAAPQIEAFLTNATRGIAAASFVGAADLTNALNDIASFSRSQAVTYWILLIFYVVVVMIVVRLSRALNRVLERALIEDAA